MSSGHAHHHPNRGEDIVAHAEDVCRSRGTDLTPLRRRVLLALSASREPLGAYDLVETLGRERRIAPISVYRVLDFLIEVGLVHRIATRNTYLPCHHAHDPHETTVFLVCHRCGGVDEVTSRKVAQDLRGTAEAVGFTPGARAVEVEGECAACRGETPG